MRTLFLCPTELIARSRWIASLREHTERTPVPPLAVTDTMVRADILPLLIKEEVVLPRDSVWTGDYLPSEKTADGVLAHVDAVLRLYKEVVPLVYLGTIPTDEATLRVIAGFLGERDVVFVAVMPTAPGTIADWMRALRVDHVVRYADSKF